MEAGDGTGVHLRGLGRVGEYGGCADIVFFDNSINNDLNGRVRITDK